MIWAAECTGLLQQGSREITVVEVTSGPEIWKATDGAVDIFDAGVGTGITSSRGCSDRLKRHLPGYDKGINARKITRDRIDEAIRRAKLCGNPPCADWPRALGGTTVYKLVENILQV